MAIITPTERPGAEPLNHVLDRFVGMDAAPRKRAKERRDRDQEAAIGDTIAALCGGEKVAPACPALVAANHHATYVPSDVTSSQVETKWNIMPDGEA